MSDEFQFHLLFMAHQFYEKGINQLESNDLGYEIPQEIRTQLIDYWKNELNLTTQRLFDINQRLLNEQYSKCQR